MRSLISGVFEIWFLALVTVFPFQGDRLRRISEGGSLLV